jgi:hypothetical protein
MLALADGDEECLFARFGVARAHAVYAGLLPVSALMPDAQAALPASTRPGKPLL